jgi:hypothetical protein
MSKNTYDRYFLTLFKNVFKLFMHILVFLIEGAKEMTTLNAYDEHVQLFINNHKNNGKNYSKTRMKQF